MKKIILAIILFAILPVVFGQSIGVNPGQTINVSINHTTIADFGVSQGSLSKERITIEEDYDWLNIPEKEFILEPKSGKSVMMEINIKKPGNYKASIKVCASEIDEVSGALSANACARHNLDVFAEGKKSYNILIPLIIFLMLFIFILSVVIYLFSKNNNKKKKKKK
jgi:hypothetical protein